MSRSLAAAAALAAGLALAGEARADEEALKKQLDETQRQMDTLRKRVEDLEKSGKAGPAGGPTVTAPNSRKIEFSGQILVWYERWDGTYRPNDPAGQDVQDEYWLRASIQADMDIEEGLSARIEIRDARLWGSEPSTTAQTNAPGTGTDLKQGWFEARDILRTGASLRAGRQVLKYGDERLIGERDWSTYGRSFDAALFSKVFEKSRTRADLFASRVVERGAGTVTAGVDNDDQDFYGVYTTTPKALHHSDLDAYALFLHDRFATAGEQPGDDGNTGFATAGARVAGAKGNLDWGAEGAFQAGDLSGDSLAAWAGHARAGYTLLDAKWKPRFNLEWDIATGDDDPGDGDRESFQSLFPTNHKHYGVLDLMAWQNMQGVRAGVEVRPHEKLAVAVDLWRFWLFDADDAWYGVDGAVIRPGAAGADRFLGTELDAQATWTASEHFSIAFGVAQFWDGSFVRDTGGGGDTFWTYIRLLVTF